MEMLVHPLRHGHPSLVDAFERFVKQAGVTLVPISRPIPRRGAELRASILRLRTPDAIHVATALDENCACLLTDDAGLRGIQVPAVLLGDISQAP